MKTICAICKLEIDDNFRIEVYARRLGKMKKIEGYHDICWNGLINNFKENLTKHNKKLIQYCPQCHSKDIYLNHADKDYRCIKCGYEWQS